MLICNLDVTLVCLSLPSLLKVSNYTLFAFQIKVLMVLFFISTKFCPFFAIQVKGSLASYAYCSVDVPFLLNSLVYVRVQYVTMYNAFQSMV